MNHISVEELKSVLDAGDSVAVIDVRSPMEFESGHIPGAVNVPLGEVMARAEELGQYDPLYINCRSGGRSQVACLQLVSQGVPHAVNVEGGMMAWEMAGFGSE